MPARGRARSRLGRAYWNLRFWGLPNPVRDAMLILSLVFWLMSVTSQTSTLARQREGRRVAIEVLCGAQQGVIDAGRDQLLSFGQRRAARRYAVLVARGIEREAQTRGLVNVRTGRLRCQRLVKSSAAATSR